jgi:hypothetical protein
MLIFITEGKINEDNLKENIRDAFFSRFFGGTAKNMYRAIYFSRGKSQVQAFLDKGKPYRKSFKVSHTNEGLDSPLHFMKEEIPSIVDRLMCFLFSVYYKGIISPWKTLFKSFA